MKYEKRIDGRDWEELRPIDAKVDVIKEADGSAFFKIGKTAAYAAVYGPRNLYPKFLQDPSKGILRINYNMMPFSGTGERVRPGPNRRAKEISMVTEKAFMPIIELDQFPNAVVDVFIELPQTDAGSRCAGICAASLALASAGIPMKDLVGAIAVGKVADTIVVLDDWIMGKPESEDEAFQMLQALSGRTHAVYTGLGLFFKRYEKSALDAVCTKVRFRPLTEDEIWAYINTGEPFDKAGAYGIQGQGALLVEGIDGCYYNVVGLPLSRFFTMLTDFVKHFVV